MKQDLTQALLDWYDQNGREMPWRVKGGAHFNPYMVWISEIMLQQTTVQTVSNYFIRWMKRFPSIESVARSDLQDVLLMWQGLGYYTRAKKIHECARILVEKYNGKIPEQRDLLLKLPGIGPYTASSICAFAFNKPETVVDGNVIRVIARLYGLSHAVTKEEIYALAKNLTSSVRAADYASAIMDLGATVCTPVNPKCLICTWQKNCIAHKKSLTDKIPLILKQEKQKRNGTVYLIQNNNGEYFIQKRGGKGLLSGLYEFPWNTENQAPIQADWVDLKKQVSHTFTHFHLTLSAKKTKLNHSLSIDGIWCLPKDFKNYPFSTLMKKVMKLVNI